MLLVVVMWTVARGMLNLNVSRFTRYMQEARYVAIYESGTKIQNLCFHCQHKVVTVYTVKACRGSGCTAPPVLKALPQVEVSGNFYTPAALSPAVPRYPFYRRLGVHQSQSERFWIRGNVLPLPGFEHRPAIP
jgi:hypothetical protein